MPVNSRIHPALLALTFAFALSPATIAQDHDHDHSHAGEAPQQKFPGDPYLLDTDPVTGEKLGPVKQQVVIDHEGRELRFKSEKSVQAFRADPAKILAKVDEAIVRQQLPFYPPLANCPVSGEKLGEMGEPVNIVYRNRLVRLCCKGCKQKFFQNPGTHVAKLNDAVVAAQGPEYPLQTCVVSGEELGGDMGEPIDYVLGNRLVRLCCKGCQKKIAKDPLSFLAKLDGSAKAEHGHGGEGDGHGHDHGGDHGGDHHGGSQK